MLFRTAVLGAFSDWQGGQVPFLTLSYCCLSTWVHQAGALATVLGCLGPDLVHPASLYPFFETQRLRGSREEGLRVWWGRVLTQGRTLGRKTGKGNPVLLGLSMRKRAKLAAITRTRLCPYSTCSGDTSLEWPQPTQLLGE